MRLLVWALALAFVADSGAYGLPDTPVSASDSLLTKWAERFDRAAEFRVIHQEVRLRPAPFQSVLPCSYKIRIQHADDRVKGDSALAAFLGSAVRHAGSEPHLRGACTDSISGDEIELRLDRGNDLIVARYTPRWGSVTFIDARHQVRTDYPGARCAELLAMLAKNLPDDLRLESIQPCTTEPLSPAEEQNRKFVESMPEAIKKVPPDYPEDARLHGVEGTVNVLTQLDTSGRVIRTVLPDQASAFDAASVRAVEQWHFKPAMSNGKPVSVWVSIPVKFSVH